MQVTLIANPEAMRQAITDLAGACEQEIAKADRPTDAFPLKALVPMFVVGQDQLPGWMDRVPLEIWKPLATLTARCFVCPTDEHGLQSEYYALDHDDLAKFRQGIPILKFVAAIKPELTFNVGGRTKHIIEIKIREALEFEVFRRDIEIGELLSTRSRLLQKSPVVTLRGSGLEFLRKHAWIDGLPSKGKPMDKRLSKNDREIALFESLRFEGEMLAIKFVPSAASPSQVEKSILRQVAHWSAIPRTLVDCDQALAAAALSVKILMKACALVTQLTKGKRDLAKAIRNADQRAAKRAAKANQFELDLAAGAAKRPRWRPLNPIADPMTKRRHKYFSEGHFSPFELTFIAFTADVDPNLLSTRHVLATPEFNVARMLRRLYWGQQVRPEFAELRIVYELVFGPPGEHTPYTDTRAFLAKAVLELEPRERWAAWFDNPIEPLRLAVKK
jgi:hypothetical protein